MTAHIEELYMLLIERLDGAVQVATEGLKPNGKMFVARAENKSLLEENIGRQLLDDKLINGYQLIRTAGPAHRNYEIEEIEEIKIH